MKKLLKELFSYIREESLASAEAKRLKLKYIGFNLWGPAKGQPATHKTDKKTGKLIPIAAKEPPKAVQKPRGQQSPAVKSAKPATKQQPSSVSDVPQSSVIPMTDAPGNTPAAPIDPKAAKSDHTKLDKLRKDMDSIPFDSDEHKGRATTFMKLWQAFISAPTYEEQVKAVEQLIEQNLIQGTTGRSKIYIHPNVGFAAKGMCGETGTSVTKLMQKIIKERKLDLEPRDGSSASAAAAESGTTNEAGVTALLDPSDANNMLRLPVALRLVVLVLHDYNN